VNKKVMRRVVRRTKTTTKRNPTQITATRAGIVNDQKLTAQAIKITGKKKVKNKGVTMTDTKPMKILDYIIKEIKSRGGLDDAWSDIDEDIQNEILGEWLDGIKYILNKKD